MEFVALTAVLGFPLGMLIGKAASAELLTGRGWVFLLHAALLPLVLVFSLFQYLGWWGLLLFPVLFPFSGWLQKTGSILAVLSLAIRSDMAAAGLVFLYLLPAGSLQLS